MYCRRAEERHRRLRRAAGPPEPASGLTASSTPGSSIDDLFWGPSPDDPDAYAIYRSTTSGGGYVQIGTATALFYEDGGLANGTYHYVVRAVLNGVEAVDSIQANVNVDGVSAPVPALGGVTVTLSPKGKNWRGEAVVEVVDQANGQPLAGAVVTGYWTFTPDGQGGVEAAPVSLTTDGPGEARSLSANEKADTGDAFTFTASEISASGVTVDPGDPKDGTDAVPRRRRRFPARAEANPRFACRGPGDRWAGQRNIARRPSSTARIRRRPSGRRRQYCGLA